MQHSAVQFSTSTFAVHYSTIQYQHICSTVLNIYSTFQVTCTFAAHYSTIQHQHNLVPAYLHHNSAHFQHNTALVSNSIFAAQLSIKTFAVHFSANRALYSIIQHQHICSTLLNICSIFTAHFRIFTAHFSIFTSHFSLFTSHFSIFSASFHHISAYFSIFTSHFSIFPAYFSVFTAYFSIFT